jgi:hypothetical protein
VNPLKLAQPRDITALFRDSLRVYVRHAGLFILLSAAVVLPVDLVVEGIGLEMLTGRYDSTPTIAETAVPTVVRFLVVVPIITAICIYALLSIEAGERPSAGRTLVSGFEQFTPLFFAVLIAAIGIAAGFVLLVIPGIYLAVKLFFVPQTVVIGGARGTESLRRSSDMVRGFWWRTFGLVVMINLAAALPALVITAPFTGIADSTGDAAWALAGTICAESITTPFVALFSTFLYFDVRARAAPAPY